MTSVKRDCLDFLKPEYTFVRNDDTADEILSFLDKVFYYYDIPREFTTEEKMEQLFNSDQVS